jgi:type I restriction enzyme R subunit
MPRNEAETRAELIDPQLKERGWGVIEGSKVLREYRITEGRILTGGRRAKAEIADYILVYKNHKIGVIEAKPETAPPTEGVAQAKSYAEKLQIDYTYSTNGKEIYQISMKTGTEGMVEQFPTPDELWQRAVNRQNEWQEKFSEIIPEGYYEPRYFQDIAIERVLDAISEGKQRILITLATGTGKTVIAFQVAWKLFQARWNLQRNGKRRPRILFLADRNILADQAYTKFSPFPSDALVRITPDDIKQKGRVPTSGSIFFTIFQTFMSGPNNAPYFGEYPEDFFDFIIIDECHRGGANDESQWRDILEYFSPAVQLGMTATPKRDENINTYRYFGNPVYTYSLKEGINDGFLTPFRVKYIQTTIDEYLYSPDDEVVEGEIDEEKIYTEDDFNQIIEIKEREAYRVKTFLADIDPNEKTLVFCANQPHALMVRDIINQHKKRTNPFYCVRVTADDNKMGEQYLREFQDNERTIPTILTTSQKLSTGVDARNIRNIVLLRPVNQIIEFKQIIGRGTRLFEGKYYFTIYDFVGAYKHFLDPEWDGEPIDEIDIGKGEGEGEGEGGEGSEGIDKGEPEPNPEPEPEPKPEPNPGPGGIDIDPIPREPKIIIKLRDGKEREIQHMVHTSFWSSEGRPISVNEFIDKMFGDMPSFYKTEEELVEIWANPKTRENFLNKIADMGYGKEELEILQRMFKAEDSDLLDVLSYISFLKKPVTRVQRIEQAQEAIYAGITPEQKEFIDFVLQKYKDVGVSELGEDKLPGLLNLKYNTTTNAMEVLGSVSDIRSVFFELQENLYTGGLD